jgi:hypothetical protein
VTDEVDVALLAEARAKKYLGLTGQLDGDHAIDLKEWMGMGLPRALFYAISGEDGVVDEVEFVSLMKTIKLFACLAPGMTEDQAIKVYMSGENFEIVNVSALGRKKADMRAKMDDMIKKDPTLANMTGWQQFQAYMKAFGYTAADVNDNMKTFYEDFKTKYGKEPTFDELFDQLFKSFVAAHYNGDIQKSEFGIKNAFVRYSSGKAEDVELWFKGEQSYTSRTLRIDAAAVAAYNRLVKEFQDNYGFNPENIRPQDLKNPALREFMRRLGGLEKAFHSSPAIYRYKLALYERIVSVATNMSPQSAGGTIEAPQRLAAGMSCDPDDTAIAEEWISRYVDFASRCPDENTLNVYVYEFNYYNALLYNLTKLYLNTQDPEKRKEYLDRINEVQRKLDTIVAKIGELDPAKAVMAWEESGLIHAIAEVTGIDKNTWTSITKPGEGGFGDPRVKTALDKLDSWKREALDELVNASDFGEPESAPTSVVGDAQVQRNQDVMRFNLNLARLDRYREELRDRNLSEDRRAEIMVKISEIVEEQKLLLAEIEELGNPAVTRSARFLFATKLLEIAELCKTKDDQDTYIIMALEVTGAFNEDGNKLDDNSMALIYLRLVSALLAMNRHQEAAAIMYNGLEVQSERYLGLAKVKVNGKTIKLKNGKIVSSPVVIGGRTIPAMPNLGNILDYDQRVELNRRLSELQNSASMIGKKKRGWKGEDYAGSGGTFSSTDFMQGCSLRINSLAPNPKGKGKGGSGKGGPGGPGSAAGKKKKPSGPGGK